MAKPPNQYFRKEDFAEVKEPWIDKLLPKLNELARQTTYGVDGKLSVKDNLSAFWWEGDVGNFKDSAGVIFPFTVNSAPQVIKKNTPSIQAFPFSFANQLTPAKVAAIMVAQASDVTDGSQASQPALLGGVAWVSEGNKLTIYAINGMLPGRCYNVKLLVLGE
jgi:hypothetical protein